MSEQGVDEQLRRLAMLELVTTYRIANLRFYRANAAHPWFVDLRNIVRKSSGLRDVLAEALAGKGIDVAFVFGSVAKGTERAESNIGVMILGNLGLREISSALRPAGDQLGRVVNPCVFGPAEVVRRIATRDHFFREVIGSPKLFLIGDDATLSTFLANPMGRGIVR